MCAMAHVWKTHCLEGDKSCQTGQKVPATTGHLVLNLQFSTHLSCDLGQATYDFFSSLMSKWLE